MKVYINGKYYEKDEAKVSVFDHGFLYGDGIFEGIRLYSGNVFKLDKHIDRLFRSARAILLDLPWSKQQIIDAVCDACRTNGLKDGYIRLVVSRGKGKLAASLIPVVLDRANTEGKLKRGNLLALTAFGAGLTTGAGVIEW